MLRRPTHQIALAVGINDVTPVTGNGDRVVGIHVPRKYMRHEINSLFAHTLAGRIIIGPTLILQAYLW